MEHESDKPTTGCKGNKTILETEKHNRKAKWINKMKKESKEPGESPRQTYIRSCSEQQSKKDRTGKILAMITYMDSSF